MSLPTEILDALENLVEEKFNALIRDHKINAEVLSTDLTTFEEEQMIGFDGNEKIDQGFFRKFLRWLSNYFNTILTSIEEMTFDSVRYITPVDYDDPPECGKIIAPFAHLILTGSGVKPTIPDPPETTPDDAGFDLSTHLMPGGFAYNETDNRWYYRGKNQFITDWFLPSKDELWEMYEELYLYGIGGLNTEYWSSSEESSNKAYYLRLDLGQWQYGPIIKANGEYVRACRAFTSTTVYNLRDIGPSGGYIFWKSGNNYLEAAPSDLEPLGAIAWSNIVDVAIGTTGTAIGTGQANTLAIIAQEGHTTSAAKLCNDLSITGEEDYIHELKDALIGSDNYVHTQSEAATLWTVDHNLGKYPSVFIQDESGNTMIGDIVNVSINQLTIEFSTAQSGIAIIN